MFDLFADAALAIVETLVMFELFIATHSLEHACGNQQVQEFIAVWPSHTSIRPPLSNKIANQKL